MLLFSNCCKYNVGKAGKRNRKEAKRQRRRWRKEVLPGLKADLASGMSNTNEEEVEDSKRPAVISPKKRKKNESSDKEEAEFEGDLEDSDPVRLQPRQLGSSSDSVKKTKKRMRIIDDSDDE